MTFALLHHAYGDLGSVAVERAAQNATARVLDDHDVPGGRVCVGDVTAVDPWMAAAQPRFSACRNHDGRNHGEPHIVQSFAVRIAIGADHAGFVLKEHLKKTLVRLGHEVDDHGTHSDEPVDYPPICIGVARCVAAGDADRGIVVGGSGQGEQIAANKVRGVRASLCNDLFTARLARAHNDANVLAMGGRIVAFGLADDILALWLDTPFEGGRHKRRIDQITEAESA